MKSEGELSIYVITQFASQANRRIIQLLSLRDRLPGIILVSQLKGNTYTDTQTLQIAKPPKITGALRLIGFRRLERFVDRYLYFPSPNILYVKQTQKRLAREISNDLKQGKNACLITCVPPHDLVLIGLHIKKIFPQVYWIVDWQDLWSYDEYYINRVPERGQRRVRRLEQQVFSRCDMSVVSNNYAHLVLRDHYRVAPEKITTINHAFDAREGVQVRDSINGPEKSVESFIRIGFLGNLFKPPKVPGAEILKAIGEVRQLGLDVRLHIVGDKFLNKVTREPVRDLGWVTVHPETSHQESLRIISDCDFLLLALADLPNSRAIMHAKLPHYLMLRKPILAIVPNQSAVAEIIRKTGAGYVISADHNWEDELVNVLTEYKKTPNLPAVNEAEIARYSWENVSKQWLALIQNACSLKGTELT
jgi:glycosyltransferase involved in cell wall biosynthesis